MNDPLAAARGIFLGTMASLALILFAVGAGLAATGSEDLGAGCMTAACIASMFAVIVGGNCANT